MDNGAFTVIVPAFNEGVPLAATLDALHAHLAPALTRRPGSSVLVVDDGSTDETHAIAQAFVRAHAGTAHLCRHETNLGLTAAIRTGCAAVTTPYVVVYDADMSYGPETIVSLIDRLTEGDAHLVLASPYMKGGRVSNVPFVRRVASKYGNALLSLCAGGRIKTFTGMVRACETTLLSQTLSACTRGEFNAWMVAAAMRAGRTVVEIPAHLCWPPARAASPPRLSIAKLLSRTAQVIVVAWMLLFPGRALPVEQHA